MSPPVGAATAPLETVAAPVGADRSSAPDPRQPDPARPPAHAEGLELLGAMPGSGYRESPSLVRRRDGQTLQLTPLLYATLACIDGSRSYEQIAAALSERIGRTASAENARFLVEKKLRPLGVLAAADGSQPATKRSNPLLALRFRVALTNEALTRRITLPFAWLFLPVFVLPLLGAFLVSTYWVLFDKGLASSAHQAFYAPGLLLVIFGLTLLSAGFHEFGHAAACRYGGASPGVMGFGLYIVYPAFYTDVSDSYRLDRRKRLWVDLGGLYFNCIFGVLAFALWALTGWDALLLVIGTQVLQMLRQLTPVIRADGYHILADLTGVPDLFAHIGPTLRSLVPFRRHRRPAAAGTLRRWAKVIVVLWVFFVVPMLAATLILGVLMFPRLAATGWDSLGHQWHAFFVDKSHGDVPGMGLRVLSMASVALPILGIVATVTRMVRRTAMQVWRKTAGSPRRRALAVVAAVGVLAGVAWAWWPGDRYQPVRPGEQWSIPHVRDVVTPQAAASAYLGGGLTASQVGRPALILVPRQVPGQALRPAMIVTRTSPGSAPQVLVVPPTPPGTAGGTDSGWPFPWSPPTAARPGDNQAIAINTKDGTALYDTAFSLVWVGDEPVYNRNQAVAYANCTLCRTVAIAFQAVFIVGSNHTAVPVNTAEAANYHCVACQTAAVAVQLVATLDGMPDQQVVDRINALWKQLDALQGQLPNLTIAQIQARLNGLRDAIYQTLVDSGSLLIQTADQAQAHPPSADAPADPGSSTAATAGTGDTGGSTAGPSGGTTTPSPAAGTSTSGTTGTQPSEGTSAGTAPSPAADPAGSAPSSSPAPVATATDGTSTAADSSTGG